MIYRHLLRPLFFQFDPEGVHHFSFDSLRAFMALPGAKTFAQLQFCLRDPRLEREVWGLRFPNPVGLAAGFDKDGLLLDIWEYLGFGFVEVGTVTPRPQPGNPGTRLFRLPRDRAIINRMGFNNAGVDALHKRLAALKKRTLIVGANIGKNKDTPNEQAVEDYLICYEKLRDRVDYFVVNVSSPNTPGLRSLQEKEPLKRILGTLQEKNQNSGQAIPLLLKIAPDLTDAQLDDIVEVVLETEIDGIIATNTTVSREGLRSAPRLVEKIGAGGLSGAPLTRRSDQMLRDLIGKSEGRFPVIGVGGIMEEADAIERLSSGAALVQIFSGFVYRGPGFVKDILDSLTKNEDLSVP